MKTTYRPVKSTKALGTMHTQHFLIAEQERSIYDSCRFGIGRFRAEPTNYKQCLHPSDTFAYRSAHNNLFLTLRVIQKLKNYNFDFMLRCPCSCANTNLEENPGNEVLPIHSFLSRLKYPNFDHMWSFGGKFEFL